MSGRVWTSIILHLHFALLARAGMRDPEASQAVRDECTDRYCRAVDELVDRLEALWVMRLMGDIGDYLARRERG